MFPIGTVLSLITGKWIFLLLIDVLPWVLIVLASLVGAFIEKGMGPKSS
jgi:hypothetical protein